MDKDLFDNVGMDAVEDFIDFGKLNKALEIEEGGQASEGDLPQMQEGKVTVVEGDGGLATDPSKTITTKEQINNASEGKVTIVNTDVPDPDAVAGDGQGGGAQATEGAKSSPTILNNFASALAEEGILPSLDQDKLANIKNFDDLAQAVRQEIQAHEFAQLDDTQKRYLEALKSGIPTDDFLKMEKASQEIAKVTSSDLESNETLRREILQRHYQTKGLTADKAAKLTSRAFDIGEDLSDAQEALAELQEMEGARLKNEIASRDKQRKDAEIANTKQLEALKKEIIEGKDDIIPGTNLTKQLRTKIYESMTKVVDHTKEGQPLNAVLKARMDNPKDFEMKLHYLFNMTNGFKDLSPLMRKAKSNAVNKFTESLSTSDSFWGNHGQPAVAYNDDEEMSSVISDIKSVMRAG